MKVKVTASTRFVGSKDSRVLTIDDEDIEGMSERERDDYIEECAQEALWDIVDWGWEVQQ